MAAVDGSSGRQPVRRAGLAGALVVVALIAGCGGSGSSGTSKEDKAFIARAQLRCAAALTTVQSALDSTIPGSPRDDVLARARQKMTVAASAVENLEAPADQRPAQNEVVSQMHVAAATLGRYLNDEQNNVAATSNDYNMIIQDFSQLQQVAAARNLKPCSLPIQ